MDRGQNTMGKWVYTMDRGVKIPWVGGSNTIGKGSKYHGQGGQNTMGRGFKIPWVGGRYTMGRGSKYHGLGI